MKTEKRPSRKNWISQRDAKAALWDDFAAFAEDGGLIDFCTHAGLDLANVKATDTWDAFLAHFSRAGRIEMNRYVATLASWGPIVARVKEIQQEQGRQCRQ